MGPYPKYGRDGSIVVRACNRTAKDGSVAPIIVQSLAGPVAAAPLNPFHPASNTAEGLQDHV